MANVSQSDDLSRLMDSTIAGDRRVHQPRQIVRLRDVGHPSDVRSIQPIHKTSNSILYGDMQSYFSTLNDSTYSSLHIVKQGMLLLLLLGSICTSHAAAEPLDSEQQIDFDESILPLISDRCFQCHGPDEAARESGFTCRFIGAMALEASIRDQRQNAFVKVDLLFGVQRLCRRMRSADRT